MNRQKLNKNFQIFNGIIILLTKFGHNCFDVIPLYSHPLLERFIRSLSVWHPVIVSFIRCMPGSFRSRLRSVHRPRTGMNRRTATDSLRLSKVHFYPVASVPSFEHVHNLSPDNKRTKRTSPDEERFNQTRNEQKNGRETYTNGQEETKIQLSFRRSDVIFVDM